MASVKIPSKAGCRRVSTHRLVMAKSLGRCLEPWEVVHHRDRNRANNSLANLELVTQLGHNSYTIMQREIDVLRNRIILLESELVVLRAQYSTEVV